MEQSETELPASLPKAQSATIPLAEIPTSLRGAPKIEKHLRMEQVIEVLGLAKATVWKLVNNGELARPIKITDRASVWPESEILAYLETRYAA